MENKSIEERQRKLSRIEAIGITYHSKGTLEWHTHTKKTVVKEFSRQLCNKECGIDYMCKMGSCLVIQKISQPHLNDPQQSKQIGPKQNAKPTSMK